MLMLRKKIYLTAILFLGFTYKTYAQVNQINQDTDKANASVTEALALAQEGETASQAAFEAVSPKDYPAKRALGEAKAKEAIEKYTLCITKLKMAVANFQKGAELSKKAKNTTFEKYLTLKANSFAIRMKQIGAAKAQAEAFLQETSPEKLQQKVKALTAQVEKFNEEAGKLQNQANEIEKKNPKLFTPN